MHLQPGHLRAMGQYYPGSRGRAAAGTAGGSRGFHFNVDVAFFVEIALKTAPKY